MGKTEGKEWKAKRGCDAQETNSVSRSSKEDRSRATAEMGKGKEGGQIKTPFPLWKMPASSSLKEPEEEALRPEPGFGI